MNEISDEIKVEKQLDLLEEGFFFIHVDRQNPVNAGYTGPYPRALEKRFSILGYAASFFLIFERSHARASLCFYSFHSVTETGLGFLHVLLTF